MEKGCSLSMTHEEDLKELAKALTYTAQSAGELVLRYRDSGQEVTFKEDGSPVTVADRAAEELILNDLAGLAPDILVVGEETANVALDSFDPDQPFFLVDPVDGTRGYVKGGNEFSINIALVQNREPVFGLIYAPALEKLYLTYSANEAVKATMMPQRGQKLNELDQTPLRIRPAGSGLTAVISRTHFNEETRAYLARLPIAETKNVSSSLKFTLVAEGSADLYPRLAPTMEWDTAAGHAILSAAGGHVIMKDGDPLKYGKIETKLLNPSFIAWGVTPAQVPGMAKV
jgi:3'(2'), 5'-bisphosphate nucleotidase